MPPGDCAPGIVRSPWRPSWWRWGAERAERARLALGATKEVLGFTIDFLEFKYDFLGFSYYFIVDFLGFPRISIRILPGL